MGHAKGLPNYQHKQRLLYVEGVPEREIEAAAEASEQAGIYNDALELWHKLNNNDRIAKIAEIAKDEGDLFLFRKAMTLTDTEVNQETWLQVANRALELGKVAFAKDAFTLAGDEEKAQECAMKMQPSNEENSDGQERQKEENEQGHDAA